MTIGERLAMIRKSTGLSQQKFADRLMVSRNFIAQVETGNRDMSPRMMKSVCSEFYIREEWLLTGEGEMTEPMSREREIAQITAALYEADPDGMPYKFMKALSDLKPETWKDIGEFIKKVASEEE